MSILHDDIIPALISFAQDALVSAGYGTDLDNRVRLRPMTAFTEAETPAIAIFGLSAPRGKSYGGKAVAIRATFAILVSQQHKAINDDRDAINADRDAPDKWRLCWAIAGTLEKDLLAGFRHETASAKFDGVSIDELRETPDQADPFTARIDLSLVVNLRIRDNHSL